MEMLGMMCSSLPEKWGWGEPLGLLFKSHRFILMNGHCSCCLKIILEEKEKETSAVIP